MRKQLFEGVLYFSRLNQNNAPSNGCICSEKELASLMAWTTGVSNPIRYPCFHISASVTNQKTAFAFGVPSNILEFNLSTRHSIFLS